VSRQTLDLGGLKDIYSLSIRIPEDFFGDFYPLEFTTFLSQPSHLSKLGIKSDKPRQNEERGDTAEGSVVLTFETALPSDDPLFHLLADRFCQDGVGNFLVGLALVIRSTNALDIVWTLSKLAMLVVGVISGGLIFIALNLITCVTAFWIVDSVPVTRLVFDNHQFAQYPLTIYPKAIGILLTWLIPYGFASFYPASYLLDREFGGLAWLGPFVAAILLFIGYRFWQTGLRYYSVLCFPSAGTGDILGFLQKR
jgi:hypothetical protein